jgi:hypothetical protein
MKHALPESVVSPQDLTALIQDLHAYARWFSHASVRKRVTGGKTADPPEISGAAELLLKSWMSKGELTAQQLDNMIEDLEYFRETSPVVKITLAAPPSSALRKTLATWCRENIAPNALVSFAFNATLLGGMVVIYGSQIFDWSFRRQILTNRQRFPEILRNV